MAVAIVALLALAAAGFAADTHWQVSTGSWSDDSNWTNGLPEPLNNAHIGNGGEASIDQSGGACINVFLGRLGYQSGTIRMISGELSASSTMHVGYSGRGTFLHSGGTNAVAGTLYLAYDYGSRGRYELGGEGELSAAYEYLGRYGTGTFVQTGGTNTVYGTLYVAYGAGSSGRYELSGTGRLSAAYQHVGRDGAATFVQSGGNNTISDTLYLQSGGTYELGGTGTLRADREIRIGVGSGAGRLDWLGGELTTPTITLGAPGTLALGFDFQVDSLLGGGLFYGGTLNGLELATLEVTNGATATHADFASAAVGKLVLGTGTGPGTYGLEDGSLSANSQYVGQQGTGMLSQTGGTNTIAGGLYLAHTPGSSGAYQLSESGELSAADEYIGYSGTAILTQTGAANTVAGGLYLAHESGSSGTYELAGVGGLSAANAYVGYSGTGTLSQNGGTTTISDGLYLAHQPGSSGTYDLGPSGVLSASNQYVGEQGTGTLAQTGGTNAISGGLYLAHEPGSSGTYQLSQSAELSASHQYVGYGGGGTFLHDGGKNAVAGTLYLGYESGSSGRYELSGTGELAATDQYIGRAGTGTLAQTGGTNTISGTLYLQSGGTYELGGTGVLTAGGGIRIGTGSGAGRLAWLGGGLTTPTITLGTQATLALGFDFQMAALLGGGLFHGSTLSGLDLGTLEVTNDATATHGSAVTGSLGALILGTSTGPGTYVLDNGALSAGSQHVGDSGTGVLSQIGGTNTVSGELHVGYTSGGNGTYALSGSGRLSAPREHVGFEGAGTFTHRSGDNAIASELYIGYGPGSSGRYELSGTGGLSAADQYVGGQGTGNLTQTGGTNTVANDLHVGYDLGGSGTYALRGTGQLLASDEYIGRSGGGTFLHSGGANAVAGTLYLGYNFDSSGRYELSGTGQLLAVDEHIGRYGTGTFVQTGGANTVSKSLYIQGAGAYELSGTAGLSAVSEYVGHSGEGRLTQAGGTNRVAAALFVGNTPNSDGTYELSGTGQLYAASEYVGHSGTARFIHAGGRNTILQSLYLGYGRLGDGAYELSGTGQLYVSSEYVGLEGAGQFVQSGGINAVWGSLDLGSGWQAHGTYKLTGGILAVRTGGHNRLAVGVSDGTGTFELGDANGAGTISETGSADGVSMVVHGSATFLGAGTFRGWGTVGLTGTLENNGRVIADGHLTDRTLDLSGFSAVTNDDSVGIVQGDDTVAGWYAQNYGKLVLPAVAVTPGSNAYNWGEDPADGTLELVNSVRMALADVTSGGGLSIDLLAAYHGDLPPGTTGSILGTWNFRPPAGFAFSSADLTFRYDDVLAGSLGLSESGLSVYQFVGGAWVDVTGGIDVINKWITADGVSSLSTFAVGSDVTVPNQWIGPDGGTYGNPANWTESIVPGGVDAVAYLLDKISGDAAVTVTSAVTVGTLELRNAGSYTIAGPAGITLATSGGQRRIIVPRGNHTISAPLRITGDLTVDTGPATGLALAPVGLELVAGELTKDGPGTLVISSGLIFTGDVHVSRGVLEVGHDLLAYAPSPQGTPRQIELGDGATLRTGGSVTGRVLGAPTSRLEATGTMDVGDLRDPGGYSFPGKLEVGLHLVGLKDADLAELHSARIDGGTLTSFNGIEVQPVDVWDLDKDEWVTGHGTIHGHVHLAVNVDSGEMAAIAGDGPDELIVMDGIVTGSGWLEYARITGLHRPGASAGFALLSTGFNVQDTEVGIEGPRGFAVAAPSPSRGYDQLFAAMGKHLVDGNLTVKLEGSYVPAATDRFEIFRSFAPDGNPRDAGWYDDWFGNVGLGSPDRPWPNPESWTWEFEYTEGHVGRGSQPAGAFYGATLVMVPQPGTLVMLGMGGLCGLVCTRRRRRRPAR